MSLSKKKEFKEKAQNSKHKMPNTTPRYHENSRLPSRVRVLMPTILFYLFAPLLHLLLRMWGKVPAHGLENLDDAESLARERGVGILFVSNHTNEVDPFVIGTSMYWRKPFVPCYAVSRVKERYRHYGPASIFFGGRLFWSFGTYPVLQGLRNYSKAIPFHEKLLLRGKTALIFIEGGILDRPLETAKGGAGYLVGKTGAIIVPVAVCGAANLSGKELFLGKRKIFASFGKPMLPEDICALDMHHEPIHCKAGSTKILEAIKEILFAEGYVEKTGSGYTYVLP